MRFGQSTEEYEKEQASRSTGSGAFIKYLRKGDNYLHIIDEPEKWVWYWEHYNPGGYPFPCTGERDTCPGCTSTNEQMKSASRRAAFNAYDGQYVNVWKVPKTVAEKLRVRHERLGTITDRPYVITQIKNDQGRYDYDIEGQEKQLLDMAEVAKHVRDPEDLLAEAYEAAWGSPERTPTPTQQANAQAMEHYAQAAHQAAQKEEVDPWTGAAAARAEQEKAQPEKPPFEAAAEEDHEYSEASLRKMSPEALRSLCAKEELYGLPSEIANDSDKIVDWMIAKIS